MAGESGRGWGTVAALALATLLLSALSPALLIFVPLSLLLLALPPRRPPLVLAGAVLALVALWIPGGGPLWYIERGWALVVGAWFVFLAAAWPGARFLSRALGALGASVASVALCLALTRGGWAYLDWTVSRHFRSAAAAAGTAWAAASGGDGFAGRFSEGVYRAAELQALLHPALLALGTLSALAVAWWAYRRLAAEERRPFAPFREFRFPDDLVWALIAGVVLLVLPLGEAAARTGSNVLAFMGALYLLRGAAVLLALLGIKGVGGAVLALVALLFLPMVTLATALVGLTDTWVDLRARRSAAGPGS